MHKFVRSQRNTGEAALQALEKTLQSPIKDASVALEEAARELGFDDIIAGWRGAQASLYVDPSEAITRACSLVESVCKHITEKATGSLPSGDIQSVYKGASKVLQLSPDSQMSLDLKQMLSGVISVVNGIGSFRTHSGSAHGRGPESQAPTLAQARLSSNLAGTVSTFLMETFKLSPKLPPQPAPPLPQ